jgi:type II pantothenate kinase
MPVLCQLADPDAYRPCTWDLLEDLRSRRYWLDHFEQNIEYPFKLQADLPGTDSASTAACRTEYLAGLQTLRQTPDAFGPLNILTLDRHRSEILRKHGLTDPYAQVKHTENQAAIQLYPRIIAELDPLAPRSRSETLTKNIFAGNIFDLGSIATIDQYTAGGLDFDKTRSQLKPRPWLIDEFDPWCDRIHPSQPPYRRILFFVDNAGADVILGCIPLARHLAQAGAHVVLAANDQPVLNDITITELREVLTALNPLDPVLKNLLAADRITTVPAGNAMPLIDLRDVSEECNAAAQDADLIILEGMGRSVESNLHAEFKCDTLKIAMIKDQNVADHLNGSLFDLSLRFEKTNS